jgi:two-component system, LytTR family, sensor kinase
MVRWQRNWKGTGLGSASRHAVYDVLSMANQIAPVLRSGLVSGKSGFDRNRDRNALATLCSMLGALQIALTDTQHVLSWALPDGVDEPPVSLTQVMVDANEVLNGHELQVCDLDGVRVVVCPLIVDHHVAGSLCVYVDQHDADLALVRACEEIARWVGTQVQLGELDRARAVAAGAQLKALRAQISPHFLFNALNTIASFVRTDPDRARSLLVEFADFARYSFSTTGQFTTLADELRAIDTFVAIERARFGDRLTVKIRVAPEVLGVKIPFLVLQPLVENALQHGLYRKGGQGTLSIDAADEGSVAVITLDDDGVGMSPSDLAETLAGRGGSSGIGLRNVDERMRTVFGPAFGLVIETNVNAGTRVTIRVPKTLPAGVMQ